MIVEWFLIILGVLSLGLGFLMEHPVFRERITRPWIEQQWVREETRVKQTRQQVEKAREDVVMLLEELDRASEKVVELMTHWAEKAHTQTVQVPSTQAPLIQASSQLPSTRESSQGASTRVPLTQVPETQAQATQLPEPEAARATGRPVSIESAKKRRNEASGTVPEKGKHVLKDKYKTVLDLAEQGLSIDDIAQTAKIGKGEVQLLLDLQNRGGKG